MGLAAVLAEASRRLISHHQVTHHQIIRPALRAAEASGEVVSLPQRRTFIYPLANQ
jgi:hypothetical protein